MTRRPEAVANVHINPAPAIDFGLAATQQLPDILKSLGAQQPLLITDANLLAIGLLEDPLAQLDGAGCAATVFADTQADPPEQNVIEACELGLANSCDAVIGFGGGSSMDVAKLVAVLAHPSNVDALGLQEMYGVEQFDAPRLPLVQVPTTAGTGSEATSVAIITTGETTKAGVVSHCLVADNIVLDPLLTVGLPPSITATTGIDAMVHAIEAFTSKRLKNPVADMFALRALSLLASNIQSAVLDGDDVPTRSNMLLGAMLAGQAFANAPVGGVHALAYPLGGLFHVSHGLSNSLVLPHVLRFNADAADEHYSQLASNIFNSVVATGGATLMADYFEQLAKSFSLPIKLRDVGVTEPALVTLAEQAMLQTRLLINNPKPLDLSNALDIYTWAY